MNKLKIFLPLIFLCSGLFPAFAQYKISGYVKSSMDSASVTYQLVALEPVNVSVLTDESGYFEFLNLPDGHYTIHSKGLDSDPIEKKVKVHGKNVSLILVLHYNHKQLDDVIIVGQNDNSHMKATENMGIYEGKKSEVIILDSLVANVSTNNARQVYARVPGLNIWENDGAGLQLSIGGRGLDPNRTSNFNVRQNGYDISADALGYPESYYTPPTEGVERIQVVRGAASLQYGTQFGGLLNFVMRKPVSDKKIQLLARQSFGSFGFYNAFTSLSGKVGKLSYYTFFQYKKGNGWKPNSQFETFNYYGNVNYQFTEKTSLGIDVTVMDYLAQQPGGLSDKMFLVDARQSNRARNWFKVKWNMMALHFNHKFNASNEFNLRVFGLSASRYSLGFRPNRVETEDDGSERDLITGDFTNWGAEARYLKRYSIKNKNFVLLLGARYYQGFNHSIQGLGSKGSDADFSFTKNEETSYDYTFPNRNWAAFAENIFYLNDYISITPGVRYEFINTTAKGYYGNIFKDLAGNVIAIQRTNEERNSQRQFLLGGVGLSVRPSSHINVYANISQNYRSITFNDMRIANPSSVIDPNLQDEKGYSADIGVRSEKTSVFIYDLSLFYISYNNRIGEVLTYDENDRVIRERTNIGQAGMYGLETYVEASVLKIFNPDMERWGLTLFSNMAFIKSEYIKSNIPGVKGNQVEFVPAVNTKLGIRMKYRKLKLSMQYSYVSDQYSDATNALDGGISGVVGIIPEYEIVDLSLSYDYKMFRLEGSVNNLMNSMYYTRRATGYPGPGILPSDGRGFYVTLQVKL